MLDQALSLWRGPPLADFRYEPFAQTEITRLEELYLTCLEERAEARLALGSAGELAAELGALVSEHPLRERLRGQLMLALYRSGRQADALEVYRDFRSTLAEELGLEPSPDLGELETAILRQDAALLPGSGSAGTPAPGPVTGGTPLTRRPVTVLCVVLQMASGSGLALDPEAHEVVNEHLAASLTAVLERYGGKLASSDSERMMGVFGVASLHEDDALRAAQASLATRDALAAEADTLRRRQGASLMCRFGLATGEALVGGSGPLGFAGDVGARAVTLAEAAAPGQILISRQTQQLAAAALDTDSAGPDRFLLRSAHAGARPLAVRLDAPLVNRDQEMHLLQAAYARATRERVTMTVSVIGEAGQGKTRLVQESAERLGREANVLTGRCLPYGEGITFWPLRELVHQAAGGHDSPERIRALLGGDADAAGVAERLHRALGPGNQGRSDAAEIFWAARRFLEVLARSRPLLVVFEDLHWAEPTFLDLVESLALPPGGSPIALVCIARPELLEQRPAWTAEADRAVSIELPPLDEGPAASLLDTLTAGQRLPPSTRARLMDTAAGNPLYLEQLAVSLSEQAGSDRPALPPTIQALLAARLQRLGPGAGSVLARAAIVGKEFGLQSVRELLPPEARDPLGRNLQTLMAKGLVQEGPGRSPAEQYSFRHILIQQAAYRAIPKSLRAELHQRFADWLEFGMSEPVPGLAEIVGYHLEQAVRYGNELWPAQAQSAALSLRAAGHLETAGRAAHDRGDDLAAVNLLERAAALLPGDDPALGRLYTSLGAALAEAGSSKGQGHPRPGPAPRGRRRGRGPSRARAGAGFATGPAAGSARAETEITRALPECGASRPEPGRAGHRPDPAARGRAHWNHARSAASEDAWERAADPRVVNQRRELAEILSWLASASLWGNRPPRRSGDARTTSTRSATRPSAGPSSFATRRACTRCRTT